MTRPAPPACAIPKVNAQQWKKLRTPAAGPMSGLPSGAYGIGPLMTRLTPTDASSGTRAHAASIARRFDHVLGVDRSCRGLDAPPARGQLADGRHRSVPVDAGAQIAGALGERLRQLRRVDIAIAGIPEAQADSVELEERVSC